MLNTDNDTSPFFISKLQNLRDPIILELGVNKGGSTIKFLEYVNKNNGELFSIDIKDCSLINKSEKFKGINSQKWNFLQSNDLNIRYILEKFPKLKKGIDLLYIDSYHDETHVKKILERWFIYVKKNGYIYFDDTESLLYRKSKNFALSVNNDAIDKLVKNFYYQNSHQVSYVKYFKGSGLSEYKKHSELGTKPILNRKVWNYNSILSGIYLSLKKIIYKLKSKDR